MYSLPKGLLSANFTEFGGIYLFFLNADSGEHVPVVFVVGPLTMREMNYLATSCGVSL